MEVHAHVPLAPLTTLGLGGPARRLFRVTDDAEVPAALADAGARGERVLVLGGGSNLVVADAGFDGAVLAMATRGVSFAEEGDGALVVAAAGEDWDAFVDEVTARGLAGLECLAGIPGKVGATPMQNVGAYGQEVSDTIAWVDAYDRQEGRRVRLPGEACGFGYRASRFRGSERWVITRVAFRFERRPDSAAIRYAELARALGVPEGGRAPLGVVRETVRALRRGKGMVVDAADPDSRSAGSFFTNPLLSSEAFDLLVARVLGAGIRAPIPSFPDVGGRRKVAAAWLIEQAGFRKGFEQGGAGISTKHALALVNRGGDTAALVALARAIRDGVAARFGVHLEPEPVFVGVSL